MNLDLQAIGITQDELQNRVIDALVTRLMTNQVWDYEEGEECATVSPFQRKLRDAIQKSLDDKFEKVRNETILPRIEKQVDDLILQTTNRWGEKKGEPVSFTEYMVGRIDQITKEPVDAKGRTRSECELRGDSFYKKSENCLTQMIDSQIEKHIKAVSTQLVKDAVETVRDGLIETVKSTFNADTLGIKIALDRK